MSSSHVVVSCRSPAIARLWGCNRAGVKDAASPMSSRRNRFHSAVAAPETSGGRNGLLIVAVQRNTRQCVRWPACAANTVPGRVVTAGGEAERSGKRELAAPCGAAITIRIGEMRHLAAERGGDPLAAVGLLGARGGSSCFARLQWVTVWRRW